MGRASSHSAGRADRRRPMLIVLTVAVMLIVPAAIAWACNPQAYLRLDQPGYSAGAQMQVSGAFFRGNRELVLSFEPGGQAGKVKTASNGFFATPLTAPTTPGSYTLSAVGYEEDGSITNGLPARVSFEVSAATQPSQPGAQPQPNQPGAQPQPNQPGAQPRPIQPGAGQPTFAEPEEPSARPFPPQGGSPRGDGRAEPRRGGAGGSTGPVNTGGTGPVIKTPTGDVFADSVARDDRGVALASPGQSPSGQSPSGQSGAAAQGRATDTNGREAVSEGSAAGDVWSGFGSTEAPSLTGATDAAPDGGAASQLAWGLGLLALGLVALAGGLTATVVRRRRAPAR